MEIKFRMSRTPQLSRFALLPALLLAVGLFAAHVQTVDAQAPAPNNQATVQAEVSSSLPDSIIRQGSIFESQDQWGEALTLYQQALKDNPHDRTLQTKRAVARIHFDLNRRYSDTSFIKTINTTDANTSMNVYAEVLLKVQSYYVDQPNWADLASYGLTSLEVALMSPDFRKVNLPGVTESQIRSTILDTRKLLAAKTVNDRHDAYMVASDTAKHLQNTIGLSVPATMYEFVCGAISALDPYSAFMSSNQYSETMSQIEGNFVGLGVELRTHPDHLEIVSVIAGGSAGQGGIVKGDEIIAVDNRDVESIGSERAADMMRGLEGTFVGITLDRGQGPQTVKLERRRVEIPSVDQVGIVDTQASVGYIRLTNFQKTTARDFDAALWKLHRDGMRSLIVDVRGNPGGLLSASVEVADRFVGSGVIVSTRGRNPMEDFVHRANMASTWRVPLVVLVDENSASASEIFAAAIRDHHRGTIVGHQSYGKGSVQGIFPLNVSGGGVRLTTAKFFSPTGQAISQVGVKADILVHETAKSGDQEEADDDSGLRIGIQTARRSMEQRNAALQSQTSARSELQKKQFAER